MYTYIVHIYIVYIYGTKMLRSQIYMTYSLDKEAGKKSV